MLSGYSTRGGWWGLGELVDETRAPHPPGELRVSEGQILVTFCLPSQSSPSFCRTIFTHRKYHPTHHWYSSSTEGCTNLLKPGNHTSSDHYCGRMCCRCYTAFTTIIILKFFDPPSRIKYDAPSADLTSLHSTNSMARFCINKYDGRQFAMVHHRYSLPR